MECAADLNRGRRRLNERDGLFGFRFRVLELRHQYPVEFRQDRWRNDQLRQASADRNYASVGCPAPQQSRNEDVAIKNDPHLRNRVKDLVNERLPLLFGQAREV